eukprot:gene5529-3988_t
MLGASTLKHASSEHKECNATLPVVPARTAEEIEELIQRYTPQGIQCKPGSQTLWCLLCTASKIRTTNAPLISCLTIVGENEEDIRKHCRTRQHLLCYEEKNPKQHCCPISLHGQKILLENHCVYPSTSFGPGLVLMDESMSEKTLLSQDVCGGVKLWPFHQYTLVELVLPDIELPELNMELRNCFTDSQWPQLSETEKIMMEDYSVVYLKAFCRVKRLRPTTDVLDSTNRRINRQLEQWQGSELGTGCDVKK